MKKYNVIVIGLGLIGMRYGLDPKRKQPASHIAAILENKNLQLIGVCDTEKNARDLFTEKYKKIHVFDNFSDLASKINQKQIDCDIIVISTPDSTHVEILNSLVENLNHIEKSVIIFCEKPLTPDLYTAKQVKSLIKNPHIKIVVNHTRRWSEIWNEAHILSKDIGHIKKAAFYFSTTAENKEINQIRDGIHIADLMNWFNILEKTRAKENHPPCVKSHFDGFIEMKLILSFPYFIYDFYLWGSKGKIEILSNGQILNFFKSKESSKYEGYQDLELICTKKVNESFFSKIYKEFVEFLDGSISSLSTNIDDAISALLLRNMYLIWRNLKLGDETF